MSNHDDIKLFQIENEKLGCKKMIIPSDRDALAVVIQKTDKTATKCWKPLCAFCTKWREYKFEKGSVTDNYHH